MSDKENLQLSRPPMAKGDPPRLAADESMSGGLLTAIQSEPCWDCDASREVAVLNNESRDTE